MSAFFFSHLYRKIYIFTYSMNYISVSDKTEQK